MRASITANLPARDVAATEAFYHSLGFKTLFRSDTWMILDLDGARVEFFPHPDLVPAESWFSACLRVADLEEAHARFAQADLARDTISIPRLTELFHHAGAPRMFALVDANGSLWRVMDLEDPKV